MDTQPVVNKRNGAIGMSPTHEMSPSSTLIDENSMPNYATSSYSSDREEISCRRYFYLGVGVGGLLTSTAAAFAVAAGSLPLLAMSPVILGGMIVGGLVGSYIDYHSGNPFTSNE